MAAVTDSPIDIQPKTKQARERMDQAVARLESALDKVAKPGPQKGAGSTAKLESLVEENIRLKEVNDTVAGRLDTAINRLSQVLEGV